MELIKRKKLVILILSKKSHFEMFSIPSNSKLYILMSPLY